MTILMNSEGQLSNCKKLNKSVIYTFVQTYKVSENIYSSLSTCSLRNPVFWVDQTLPKQIPLSNHDKYNTTVNFIFQLAFLIFCHSANTWHFLMHQNF